MVSINAVLSIGFSLVSILIGVVAWCFKIVTRVSILETEMQAVQKIQDEIKLDVKEILRLIRQHPIRT